MCLNTTVVKEAIDFVDSSPDNVRAGDYVCCVVRTRGPLRELQLELCCCSKLYFSVMNMSSDLNDKSPNMSANMRIEFKNNGENGCKRAKRQEEKSFNAKI